jgi:hypothetical protein
LRARADYLIPVFQLESQSLPSTIRSGSQGENRGASSIGQR